MMKNQKKVAPKISIAIAARMGSSRVPGKSMLDISGHPVIWHIIQIAKKVSGVNSICLATTNLDEDMVLVDIARQEGISIYRGDDEKVLDRLYGAALQECADILVEIGGDCPLLDPAIVTEALKEFIKKECDYLSNYSPPTFPEGMDINIIKVEALKRAWMSAVAPSQRIHPFSYLSFHPELFSICNFDNSENLSDYHWSLDYVEDIPFIRMAYQKIWDRRNPICYNQLMELLRGDREFNAENTKNKRFKVDHAFWNSPGIIKDIKSDVLALAKNALEQKNSAQYYEEIVNLSEILIKIEKENE